MKKTPSVYLEDIIVSINKIESFVTDLTFDDFCKDIKTQDAVIRNLEVIGEATNRLSEEFYSSHPSFPAKEAITMRNFLIHDYDSIDLMVVWKTIKKDIFELKNEINRINGKG